MIIGYLNPHWIESSESAVMQAAAGFVMRWPAGLLVLGLVWALGSVGLALWAAARLFA